MAICSHCTGPQEARCPWKHLLHPLPYLDVEIEGVGLERALRGCPSLGQGDAQKPRLLPTLRCGHGEGPSAPSPALLAQPPPVALHR